MRVEYDVRFLRDVGAIRDKRMQARIRSAIERIERAGALEDVPGLKRLRATGPHYRLRIGGYRLGLLAQGDVVVFVRALPRKDIYRHFR